MEKLMRCLALAGGNCNMVLVTNIYGEAAQLEETVRSYSQSRQTRTPPGADTLPRARDALEPVPKGFKPAPRVNPESG